MSKSITTLIHTALLCEATPFIQELKLQKDKTTKNIYENDNIVLIVSGVGKANTLKSLNEIFKIYNIKKAINIGVAGCSNKNIPIGKLFCVSNNTKNIENATIKSYDFVVNSSLNIDTTLVDMEFEQFLKECKNNSIKEIYSFKVVSDYLRENSLKKEFVTKIIYKNILKIKEYL